MRRSLLLILASVFIVGYMDADTYIKVKTHTDSYYYNGIVYPAEDSVCEIWIGDKKMSLITSNRTSIVDLNSNQMFIINPNDGTYVETELPLDVEEVASKRSLSYPRSGTVNRLDTSKTIENWNCKSYFINSYTLVRNSRLWDTDTEIWVTEEVPFNLNDFQEMNINIEMLEVLDEKYLKELKKIKGFCIFSESKLYIDGFSVKSYRKVIEMTEKNPPPRVYTVPSDFAKKDQLF